MSIAITEGQRFGNKVLYTIERRQFPAGETFIQLPAEVIPPQGQLYITVNFEGDSDLFALALTVDALRRKLGDVPLILELPYLPYARQDRVCAPGESLSLKVVADFINSMKFTKVVCHDVHSSVGTALIDNIEHRDLNIVARKLTTFRNVLDTVLVSPDAGANKKVLDFAKYHGYHHVVRADKTRDVLTGQITGTAVYSEHIGSKDFLILDDICDGGRTFIELAKELRKLTDGNIYLYVTHGIFSAGYAVFDGLIDRIYVSNLMNKESSPLLTAV